MDYHFNFHVSANIIIWHARWCMKIVSILNIRIYLICSFALFEASVLFLKHAVHFCSFNFWNYILYLHQAITDFTPLSTEIFCLWWQGILWWRLCTGLSFAIYLVCAVTYYKVAKCCMIRFPDQFVYPGTELQPN